LLQVGFFCCHALMAVTAGTAMWSFVQLLRHKAAMQHLRAASIPEAARSAMATLGLVSMLHPIHAVSNQWHDDTAFSVYIPVLLLHQGWLSDRWL
jgi:hypothetical protein